MKPPKSRPPRVLPADPFPGADPDDPFVEAYHAAQSDEVRFFMLDALKKADPKAARRRQWLNQLGLCAKSIDALGTKADGSTFEVFWLRLYGVLAELPKTLKGLTALAQTYPDHEHLAPARASYEAVEAMRALLTEEDVIMLDWMRQRAAHLDQTGYTVRFEPNNQLADDDRRIDLLSKTYTIAQVDLSRHECLQRHGGDREFACYLVDQLRKPMIALLLASGVMHIDQP